MEKNVGGLDRKMRIAAGALAGITSLTILKLEKELITHETLQTAKIDPVFSLILGVLALILLGTAYTQKCPVCNALDHDSTE